MRQEVPEDEFEKTCNRPETRRTHQGHRLKRNPYRILADAHLQKHLTSNKKSASVPRGNQTEVQREGDRKGFDSFP